jgi:hypothetical protein
MKTTPPPPQQFDSYKKKASQVIEFRVPLRNGGLIICLGQPFKRTLRLHHLEISKDWNGEAK